MKVIQHAVRTQTKPNGYQYYVDSMSILNKYLDQGYIVVMCNQIGVELEYIVQKTVTDEEAESALKKR